MKLSEMIENLQKFKNEHGDVDCWWAVDDEMAEQARNILIGVIEKDKHRRANADTTEL